MRGLLSGIIASSLLSEAVDPGPGPGGGLGMPSALLVARKGSAAQNVTNFEQDCTFQDVIVNTFGFVAPGPNIVIPDGVGLVVVNVVMHTSSGLNAPFILWARKNGVPFTEKETAGPFWFPVELRAAIPVSPGDILTFRFRHFSFGAVPLSPNCRVSIMGWAS